MSEQDVDCEQVLHELSVFLDGELTPEKKGDVGHHLERCSHCLEVFDFEAELRQLVAQCCRQDVPDELRQRVLQVIARLEADEAGDPAGS